MSNIRLADATWWNVLSWLLGISVLFEKYESDWLLSMHFKNNLGVSFASFPRAKGVINKASLVMLHLGSWRQQQRHLVLAAAISPAETLQVVLPLLDKTEDLPGFQKRQTLFSARAYMSSYKWWEATALHSTFWLGVFPLLYHLGLGRHIHFPGMTKWRITNLVG